MSFNAEKDIGRRSGSPKRLAKPLNLHDLIRDGNATYDLNCNPFDQNNDLDYDDPEQCFKEKIWEHTNLEVLDGGDDDSDPNLSPFEKIRKRMTNVTKDGKIMKLIKKEGTGNVCPPKSHVKIHYQGYLEYKEIPFDVSYLRDKNAESYKLGDGRLIDGLELGIETMKVGEKAQFLIHHDYAYKSLGISPRIPAKATVLFEVYLVSFSENLDFSNEVEEKLTLETVAERAEAHVKKGSERLTQDRDEELAIRHYKEARNLILDFGVDNDKDGVLANLLNRAYQNLAICYNRKKDYKSTLQMAEDAMIVIRPLADKNCKLKFAWGKALSAMHEYEKALAKLKEVKKMQPASQDVTKELQALEMKWKKYEDDKKKVAQKFFKMDDSKQEQKESPVPDSFIKSMTEQLQQLKLNENVKSLNLNAVMTGNERKVVKDIATNLGLHYSENNSFGKGAIVIRK